jgi:hypothetical protein
MIVKDDKALIPGKWYAVGFYGLEADVVDWFSAPIYLYEGHGDWFDENDIEIFDIADPSGVLERTHPGCADEFCLQS